METVDQGKNPFQIVSLPIYLAGEIRQFESNFLLLELSDLSYFRSSEKSIEFGTEENTVGLMNTLQYDSRLL